MLREEEIKGTFLATVPITNMFGNEFNYSGWASEITMYIMENDERYKNVHRIFSLIDNHIIDIPIIGVNTEGVDDTIIVSLFIGSDGYSLKKIYCKMHRDKYSNIVDILQKIGYISASYKCNTMHFLPMVLLSFYNDMSKYHDYGFSFEEACDVIVDYLSNSVSASYNVDLRTIATVVSNHFAPIINSSLNEDLNKLTNGYKNAKRLQTKYDTQLALTAAAKNALASPEKLKEYQDILRDIEGMKLEQEIEKAKAARRSLQLENARIKHTDDVKLDAALSKARKDYSKFFSNTKKEAEEAEELYKEYKAAAYNARLLISPYTTAGLQKMINFYISSDGLREVIKTEGIKVHRIDDNVTKVAIPMYKSTMDADTITSGEIGFMLRKFSEDMVTMLDGYEVSELIDANTFESSIVLEDEHWQDLVIVTLTKSKR